MVRSPHGPRPLNTPPDDRSALARAFELGSLATTIALEMVVPIVLGSWLDGWLGTKAVFTIVGGVLGMAGGLWHRSAWPGN